ncbi:MAG: hypothetical protein K6G12_11750 [Lachnospiraceae bacterium]|nr:hypothetical protein [Lachnospiraceae bacterium]
MEPVKFDQIRNSMQAESYARMQSIKKSDLPSETDNGQKAAAENTERVQSRVEDAASKGVYGNVLDISEDGDTVSARPEALQKLDDGMVMLRQDVPNTENEKAESKPEDAKSLMELEEAEAEKRQQIREELEAKAEAAKEARKELLDENMKADEEQEEEKSRVNEETSKAAQDEKASDQKDSDNTADNKNVEEKINSRQRDTQMERRAELEEEGPDAEDDLQKVKDNNKEFNETMGTINAAADQDALESDALITAAENGRVDIIKDIFDPNSDK